MYMYIYLPVGDVSISEDDIKVKRSELRLYCDLLMQQVHSVKSSVTDVQVPDSQVCVGSPLLYI